MRKSRIDGPWGKCSGAVSLTFDDGLETQLLRAVPMLETHGLRGTFYLIPFGDDWEDRLAPWRVVGEKGHEIGNHSLSHICSDQFSGAPGGLEERSLDEIEADILSAQARLARLAPQQTCWTFCYPCYCTFVGRGIERQSYVPVVARHFLAGRAGDDWRFGNAPKVVDLACVASVPADRLSGSAMIGLAEELTAAGRWVVFTFHEISGYRLNVSEHDFGCLLKYLASNRGRIWCAPFGEVAGAVAQWQAEDS